MYAALMPTAISKTSGEWGKTNMKRLARRYDPERIFDSGIRVPMEYMRIAMKNIIFAWNQSNNHARRELESLTLFLPE